MPEIFIECMVPRRRTMADHGKAALYVALFLILMFAAMTVDFAILSALVPFLFAGGIFLLWYLISAMTVEFEYILTGGELDIDKITAKRRRKRLITVDAKVFEICEKLSESAFRPYQQVQFAKKIDASGTENPDGKYFAIGPIKNGSGKFLLVFEPDEKLKAAIKTCNRNVLKAQ